MYIKDLPTVEDRREATVTPRRQSRFRFAKDRIQKIADGAPAFTPEQRRELAAILLGARPDEAAAA